MDAVGYFLENAAPRLAEPRVRQLCVRARQGSAIARDQLLRAHAGLILHIAQCFFRSGAFLELGDLLQQGCLGLLHAIDKFDPGKRSRGKSVRFATYAHYWICHTIRREIENHGRTVAIPIQRVRMLKAQGYDLESVDLGWLEDENGIARARVVSLDDDAPESGCQAWAARRAVEFLLSTLPQRTQMILRDRYALSGSPNELTQKQVGEKFNVSASQVGCEERAALHRLRRRAAELSC